MKKIAAALAFSLALIPTTVLADQIFNVPFGQNFLNDIYLPNIPLGQCLTTSTMSKVVGTGSACGSVGALTAGTGISITGTPTSPIINATGGGGGGAAPLLLVNLTNGGASLSAMAFTGSGFPIPVGYSIGHADISCAEYNPTEATSGASPQYNPLDANGLGGATVSLGIISSSFLIASPNVIGTFVIPTSPQAGPWVTNYAYTMGTPYTILSDDNVVFSVSAVSSNAQTYGNCNLYISP